MINRDLRCTQTLRPTSAYASKEGKTGQGSEHLLFRWCFCPTPVRDVAKEPKRVVLWGKSNRSSLQTIVHYDTSTAMEPGRQRGIVSGKCWAVERVPPLHQIPKEERWNGK